MKTVLVIEDEDRARWAFEQFLEGAGYRPVLAPTAEDGIEAVQTERPDIIICDVKLPGMSGLDALGVIRDLRPEAYVIIMTAYGAAQTAIEAIQRGAYDYLTKPLDLNRLRALLDRIEQSQQKRAADSPTESETDNGAAPVALIGESPAMQELYKLIGMLTMNRVTVLIEGESGVGKENVAKAIHYNSPSKDEPFVAINCGALVESLLESELFGHEKGAFTGADRQTIGKIEAAGDGTLFLDEIGSASLAIQVKLLRALQEREFHRVGGVKTLPVRARIIAATNAPLEEAVSDGSFREDLYYRLKVVSAQAPPLRERRGDIPLLVEHFLERVSSELDRPRLTVDNEAMKTLVACPWHGNVRELENAIRRAAVFCRGDAILNDHLPLEVREPTAAPHRPSSSTASYLQKAMAGIATASKPGNIYYDAQNELDRVLIRHALDRVSGNQVRAAQWLGISRTTLRRRIEELDPPSTDDA